MNSNNKGLILVNTGTGKGKTTAALGLLVRATGHNKKCAVIQFIKSTSFKYGEQIALERMGVELYIMGSGCTWESDDTDTATAIMKTWEFAKKLILSNTYDLIVLDEINIALWFSEKYTLPISLKEQVLDLLRKKPSKLHLVLTGRYAMPEIIDIADMVTEMNLIKHHYDAGVPATQGIEF
jgi:cob(I)alamin adenosyltransferase